MPADAPLGPSLIRWRNAVVMYLDAGDGVGNNIFGSIYVAFRHHYREQWAVLEQALRRASGTAPSASPAPRSHRRVRTSGCGRAHAPI